MNNITQVEIENLDRLVFNLREHYETQTGKKLGRIDVCDFTDFIEFYGGCIEYADFDGEIKSVVVKGEKDEFKIIVSNELDFESTKEKWNRDYTKMSTKKDGNLHLINRAKEMLKRGPSRYLLNMELARAFGNYVFAVRNGELNYLDALPTIHDEMRKNPTQDQINNSIEVAKKLVLKKN